MKRREQVLELLSIYKERTGKHTVSSESLFDFLQSNPSLPINLIHFKYKTKREIASFLRTHIKSKKKEGNNRTVFMI